MFAKEYLEIMVKIFIVFFLFVGNCQLFFIFFISDIVSFLMEEL
jgi:hypothetical protein